MSYRNFGKSSAEISTFRSGFYNDIHISESPFLALIINIYRILLFNVSSTDASDVYLFSCSSISYLFTIVIPHHLTLTIIIELSYKVSSNYYCKIVLQARHFRCGQMALLRCDTTQDSLSQEEWLDLNKNSRDFLKTTLVNMWGRIWSHMVHLG